MDLVDNENEFIDFLTLLKQYGEREFYIDEHASQFGNNVAFERKFSVQTPYKEFKKEMELYSAFGPLVASWYVYGESEDWGIYLAEWPTINIIGCKRHLTDQFRRVFTISGSGYSELKDFVRQEFRKEQLIKQFEIYYRLNSA